MFVLALAFFTLESVWGACPWVVRARVRVRFRLIPSGDNSANGGDAMGCPQWYDWRGVAADRLDSLELLLHADVDNLDATDLSCGWGLDLLLSMCM